MLHQPSGRKGPSPQRRKYTKKYDQIEPSSSQASPTLWGNHCGSDNRDCHTHNLAEPLCPSGSRHHWHLAVYQAPTSRLCGHARRRSTSTPRGQAQTTHTHSQGHRAVCPSATHMSIRKRDRTKPSRNATTAAQTHWCQSTMWRGHTRSTTSPKKGKRRGYISKEFCAKTDLCPLASPRVALVGVCLLRHPDKGNTR